MRHPERSSRENGPKALRYSGFIFTAVLTGCSTLITGIYPAGPATYTVAVPFVPQPFAPLQGLGYEAERAALAAADDFCAPPDLRALPLDLGKARSAVFGFFLTFQCVPPDHPAYAKFRRAYSAVLFDGEPQ